MIDASSSIIDRMPLAIGIRRRIMVANPRTSIGRPIDLESRNLRGSVPLSKRPPRPPTSLRVNDKTHFLSNIMSLVLQEKPLLLRLFEPALEVARFCRGLLLHYNCTETEQL